MLVAHRSKRSKAIARVGTPAVLGDLARRQAFVAVTFSSHTRAVRVAHSSTPQQWLELVLEQISDPEEIASLLSRQQLLKHILQTPHIDGNSSCREPLLQGGEQLGQGVVARSILAESK